MSVQTSSTTAHSVGEHKNVFASVKARPEAQWENVSKKEDSFVSEQALVHTDEKKREYQVNVELNEKQKRKLRVYCAKNDLSISEVIREFIDTL